MSDTVKEVPPAAVLTSESLPALGFTLVSTAPVRWRFDFGNFHLEAFSGMSLRAMQTMVRFIGIVFSNDSQALIDFEVMETLASMEQIKAMLAYYIDKATEHIAPPTRIPVWLVEGRVLKHLLPWEMGKRPCRVPKTPMLRTAAQVGQACDPVVGRAHGRRF